MSFFILHGLGGHSQENWFPWLASELGKEGHDVIVPDFPDADMPTFASWAEHMDQYADKIDDTAIVIGHSLGCPFGMRYLADRSKAINHFILVAPPYSDLGWDQLRDMMSGFPPDSAAAVAQKFTLFASDNDPYILLDQVHDYENLLGIEASILPGREHLWQKEIPEVLQILKN